VGTSLLLNLLRRKSSVRLKNPRASDYFFSSSFGGVASGALSAGLVSSIFVSGAGAGFLGASGPQPTAKPLRLNANANNANFFIVKPFVNSKYFSDRPSRPILRLVRRNDPAAWGFIPETLQFCQILRNLILTSKIPSN
jgi:hypothetical protein